MKIQLTLIASAVFIVVILFAGLWVFDTLVVKPSLKFASNKLIHK